MNDLGVGQCATLACLLEVTAPKPGNVHRGADFEDLTFGDLAVSGVVIGPVMEQASVRGIGKTVLDAVRATHAISVGNTNLGIVLLLAPLAAVPSGQTLRQGVAGVLWQLTPDDARLVYEAIRLARPGGLGVARHMDVADAPPADLLAAMRDAESRDRVARQYSQAYADVFEVVVPWLVDTREAGWTLTQSIVHTHVRLMAEFPDSLIARKCGMAVAEQAQFMASRVLAAGSPDDENYERALGDLDFWLRTDGHRRNPGTTADLIAAGLFVALREQLLAPPWG